MRDFKLLVLEEQGVDIDIIDGEARYLDFESQTGDQRAAIAVYAVKGTLPGNLDYGISWADQYTRTNTVAQLNNEIQQQLQLEAGSSSTSSMNTATQYSGTVLAKDGEVGVVITRG